MFVHRYCIRNDKYFKFGRTSIHIFGICYIVLNICLSNCYRKKDPHSTNIHLKSNRIAKFSFSTILYYYSTLLTILQTPIAPYKTCDLLYYMHRYCHHITITILQTDTKRAAYLLV